MSKSGKARKKFKAVTLIMAAGSSSRFGGDIPKQYLYINGKSILRKSIEEFLNHPAIDNVRVVIHPGHKKYYEEATEGLDILAPAIGDKKQRQVSVRKGLESLQRNKPDIVLIHDAARPFVNKKIIDNVLKKLEKNDAVIPVVPITDTIKKAVRSEVKNTLDRKNLWAAQTPQGFDYQTIVKYHKESEKNDFSDDSGLLEDAGIKVVTAEGDRNNFKITSGEDLKMARTLAKDSMVTKVSMGFDVHGFGRVQEHGHHIMLCGIPIVYEYELVGHSDGDVGLHAIVDAILGGIGEGDIGEHFSSGDKKWKDADSTIFVNHAVNLLQKKNGKISHIDVTLIAETPKVSPHRNAMRDRVAQLLKISKQCVSVKATTTDKLGFLGRGEGIAAHAVATIQLPQEE